MQLSMMMPLDSSMAMIHTMDMNMGNMEDSSPGAGCSDCEDSVDHFALKESSSPMNTVTAVLPVSVDSTTVFRPLSVEIATTINNGPPIRASDIVKHIVFRT